MADPPRPAFLTRLRAQIWYVWGISLCYSGNRSTDQGLYRAGVRSFSRALQIWPQFAPALYRRGLISGRELGDYQQAIRDLDQASRLDPAWPDPYLQRGLFHRFNHNPAAAISDLRHYVAIAPPGYWRDEATRQIELIRREEA